MAWYDWLIIIIPLAFVYFMGVYSRKYIKDVTTYLSAGRVCGRYVISVGEISGALSIIGLLAFVEVHYKTGFALSFWNAVMTPLSILLSLYGFCMYRFRETKAQSIGQFLEMRYSRKFRIFAAALRSVSEMLANMIMPALAARFFMYFLDLPKKFMFIGIEWNTFDVIIVLCLIAAISIICMGGSLGIIVTDTIQGFLCYPMMAIFVVFFLYKFSWNNEIMPVISERAAGESFINPYDIYNLREFNYFLLIVSFVVIILHRASWTGAGGSSSAAKSPHEQKMASLLGGWRSALGGVFYVLIAVALMTFMNHKNYSNEAHKVRQKLTNQIANDIVEDNDLRTNVITNINNAPVKTFEPGVSKKLADKDNVDTYYLANVRKSLTTKDEAKGNSLFQQFRTLYYQQMLSVSIRDMLPSGMLGLFIVLILMLMISTDDSRIFSATLTISQDVILPFIKNPLTPKQHMRMLNLVAIGIGIFFFFGSKYMAQMDYINMYVTLVCNMWLGGCGPVIVFGLYGRFGTTVGAWFSLLSGVFMSIIGVVVQRNWADIIYPWLAEHNLVEGTAKVLTAISKPFNPIVVWEMNPIKCPINSYEWYFITMMLSLLLYFGVSYLTLKEPFNIDRMLHRGKYAIDGERNISSPWTWKNMYNKFIGITPEYSFWDKVIAWFYFSYSIVYRFCFTFIGVVIWNIIDPWPVQWWGYYILIVFIIIPGIMAAITAVWFGICGPIDLVDMFRSLKNRKINELDDGRVEGNMSLADKAELEAIDADKENKEEVKEK